MSSVCSAPQHNPSHQYKTWAPPAPRTASRSSSPADSQIGHEIPGEEAGPDGGSSMSDDSDSSRPVSPMQADEDEDELEVYAQLNGSEVQPSNPHVCIICNKNFIRVQERNRHLESYLPHSILCPRPDCTWTGRRQWDFKEHWRRKHADAVQVPGEDETNIYNPKDFVKSIVDGAPVEDVARSAFNEVQEGLRRRGKPGVGGNVLGRNKDLKNWIHPPSSRLN